MRNKRGTLLITIGLLLIAAALVITVTNIQEDTRAGQTAQTVVLQLEQEIFPAGNSSPTTAPIAPEAFSPSETESEVFTGDFEIPDYILNPKMDMPEKTIADNPYIGILEVPELGLTLPIMSQWSYENLETAPCRYSGSAYTKDLIIAGHNYSSQFGQLKGLHIGDTVLFYDVDGNLFQYQVAEMETLRASAVEAMEDGTWDLSLFTCTVGGQSRLTLRCILSETEK